MFALAHPGDAYPLGKITVCRPDMPLFICSSVRLPRRTDSVARTNARSCRILADDDGRSVSAATVARDSSIRQRRNAAWRDRHDNRAIALLHLLQGTFRRPRIQFGLKAYPANAAGGNAVVVSQNSIPQNGSQITGYRR